MVNVATVKCGYGKWLIFCPNQVFRTKSYQIVTLICHINRDVFLYFCAAATKKWLYRMYLPISVINI
jgi:hypothetical protein